MKKDVQFYREASDVQFDETGNRKRKYRYGDEDEIELEQQERKRRQALNKEFKHFAEKIAEAASNSVTLYLRFWALILSDIVSYRPVTRLKRIFLSVNSPSKAFLSARTSNCNQRQNVLFTFPTHHSSSLL